MKNIVRILGIISLSFVLTSCKEELVCDDENYQLIDNECVLIEEDISYTITYHIESIGLGDNFSFVDTTKDLDQYELETAEIEGYNFSGWYRDIERTQSFLDFPFTAEEITDIHLYATFIPKEFNVTFITPEGYSTVASMTVEYGSTIVIDDYPVDRNYIWYEDEILETIYNFNNTVKGDTTLYLFLEAVEYYITYYVDNVEYAYNEYDPEDSTIEHPEPPKEGYTFLGWYLDSDFTQSLTENPIVPDEFNPNTDLYAKYERNHYTISWIMDGVLVIETTIRYNDLITYYWPDKPGYTIDGWYTDSAFTQEYRMLYMPAEDITLYAQYTSPYEVFHYTSIEAMEANYEPCHIVRFTGIVTSIGEYSYFLSDGTRNVKVSKPEIDVSIGDLITIEGFLYYDGYDSIKIYAASTIEILFTGMINPMQPMPATIEEISQFSLDDATHLGLQYTITGTIQYYLDFLSIADGGNLLIITSDTNHIAFDFLVAQCGNTVTIDVSYIGRQGIYNDRVVMFIGTIDDIEIVDTKDNLEAINEDLQWFNDMYSPYLSRNVAFFYYDPYYGPNGTIFYNFTSSHPEFLNDNLFILEFPTEPTTITLSFTATRGDIIIESSIELILIEALLLGEILVMEDTSLVATNGIVYAVDADGFYIWYPPFIGYIYVINQTDNYNPKIGEYIYIQGSWIDSIFYAVDAQILGTDFFFSPHIQTGTIEDVYNDVFPYGSLVELTVLVEYDEISGTVYLRSDDDEIFLVVDDSSNYEDLIEFHDIYITLIVIVGVDNKVLFIGTIEDIEVITVP